MKKPESIQFILSASKILSVNSLYNAKIVGNGSKSFATIYKSSQAKKTEAYIKDQVHAIGELPAWITKDTRFDMVITVIFRSGLLRRDLDNTIKLIQDGVFRALGINDSHVMSIKAYKTLCPDIPEEKVCIQLSEAVGEPRFDKLTEDLPRPSRMFLGGTCSGDPWRETLIPELDKLGISYFNPVVEDWTPECVYIENQEKETKCDCELYILTPSMKGVYSVAELVAAAYESSVGHYGSVLVGVLGTEEEWGEDKWKSLGATIDLVNQISSGSPRVKASLIESPLDILGWIQKPKRKRK